MTALRILPLRLFGGLLAVLILIHGLHAAVAIATESVLFSWSETRWDSVGLAPPPALTPEPVLQVYAARTFGWKGVFAVHSWIAFKRAGASAYQRYEVVGWRVWRGGSAVRRSGHPPDGRWAGHEPELLLDLRGAHVERLIDQVVAEIERYADAKIYRTWPGPNSNTFIAELARSVPGLGLELPPTAIGKDYLSGLRVIAPAPSNTGWQLSLFGVIGATVAWREGLELNLLGCTFGIDFEDLAVKIPGFGALPLAG
ncbi:MAG: DUF3750 domain-containing protein [Geminicoccaceae bacterium]|nr:DUF3750 domain-containing protein [Geminicoccaceae bacterium]